MIPDSRRRLEAAIEDLQAALVWDTLRLNFCCLLSSYFSCQCSLKIFIETKRALLEQNRTQWKGSSLRLMWQAECGDKDSEEAKTAESVLAEALQSSG